METQLDLSSSPNPLFTRWVLDRRLLTSPVVLVDVGVLGGAAERWDHLGDRVEVHGFDPLEEAVAPLRAEGRPHRHYYAMALGNEDGERAFFVAQEPTASSFYRQGPSQYETLDGTGINIGTRRVPIRRLDSLMAEGILARADFIKIDAEGFEPEVLKGAQALLAGGVLALEIETAFNASTEVPQTHLGALHDQLLRHGFLLYDIGFERLERASFANRARTLGREMPRTVPRPATVNALFYRDTPSLGAEETLKRAIILELYGMVDTAYDVLMMNAATLPAGFPLEEAADQLLGPVNAGTLPAEGAALSDIAPLPTDPRHTSVRVALRDSMAAVGMALRHSINYRLLRRRSS